MGRVGMGVVAGGGGGWCGDGLVVGGAFNCMVEVL